MKIVSSIPSICFLLLLTASLCYSQDYSSKVREAREDYKPPSATINQFGWISGYWTGEALGGKVDEVWSPAGGGAMMGMFRLYFGDKTEFYELCTISEEKETVILRLKHFGRNLSGWEEKDETVDFRLISVKKNLAYFDGLTFEKIDDQHMNIYVIIGEAAERYIEKFEYKLR